MTLIHILATSKLSRTIQTPSLEFGRQAGTKTLRSKSNKSIKSKVRSPKIKLREQLCI